MNCSEVQERLSAYYDGELSRDTQVRLAEHFDACASCTMELTQFERISAMAGSLNTPSPPSHIWSRLKEQLDAQLPIQPLNCQRRWSFPRLVTLAATVLVAVGIAWVALETWFRHGEHQQFAVEFGHYLEQFRRDPNAAQQMLLAKYDGQTVDAEQALRRVGYRPAAANGLPEGYSVASTYVVKMPCCTCVQCLCTRNDGSTIAIFEHDDDETAWFGDRPEVSADCGGIACRLVDLDDRIAATWKRGDRHITMIGARDVAEVNELVAWFESKVES